MQATVEATRPAARQTARQTAYGPKVLPSPGQIPEGLSERARKAAARFLEMRGYEIVEQDWECDAGTVEVVCRSEEGALVFVEVTESEGSFPPEEIDAGKRNRMESIAAAYLAANGGEADFAVRFDTLSLLVVSPDRALLRHHINCLG